MCVVINVALKVILQEYVSPDLTKVKAVLQLSILQTICSITAICPQNLSHASLWTESDSSN